MDSAVRIRGELVQELLRLAHLDPKLECCGVLGGSGGLIARIFQATNAAANPATAYEIEPVELFSLIREIRAAGLELAGIYHSHPNGKNEPSRRDIDLAYYPEAAYFIISPQAGAARPVRAFSIRDRHTIELEIAIV